MTYESVEYCQGSFKSGGLQELKNKEVIQLLNLKSGRRRLRELLVTEFYREFKQGFVRVVTEGSWSFKRGVARGLASLRMFKSLTLDWLTE